MATTLNPVTGARRARATRRRTLPGSDVRVRLVATRRDAGQFVELPYRLYRDDQCWVPPLRGEERAFWSPRRNPSLKTRVVARFLAYRGSEVVGRVAAIDDPAFTARWEPGSGVVGFFESHQDCEAARALLATAEAWLATRGLSRVVGPIELTTHDKTGFLVNGFGAPPSVLSPYNPPFYSILFEYSGYRRYREYHAYDAPLDGDPAPSVLRVVRAAERNAGTIGRTRIRTIDLSRWNMEMEVVRQLYNGAFERLWGSTPISSEEFAARAAPLRRVVDPNIALIAEHGSTPVGFALCLPDVNQALIHAGGRLFPTGWLQLIRHSSRIRAARFILLGVLPEYAQRGLGALLAYRARESVRAAGYQHLELSLVQAANDKVRRVIEAFGCPISKTYRLYSKKIVESSA